MKTSDITKFFKKNKTPLLIAAGVLVVLVVALLVWRKYRGVNSNDKNDAEDLTGQQITSGMNWKDLAVRLRKAFGGPNASGTDENEVYLVLGALRNQADWEYLKRYWTTYCESLPWWQRVNDNLMNGTDHKSLTASLIYELDNSELQRCRDILADNGITPDF